MSINAWKTSFIGLNKPAKVIAGVAESFSPVSLWPHANAIDDPYWSGGSNPQYYRWEVTFTVNDRIHGSNLTRTPFAFNAQDIEVGDFVAGAQDGKVCQIMSISEKSNNSLTAVVEDRLRYNTFRDPTGFGLFGTPGTVIFFQINELGFPMLDPVPGEAAADFFTNVMSRFQYMNPLTNYLLEQANHGFEQGDSICIENGIFALSNPDNIDRFIGTVVHPGPGPDQFILKPANGIIDFVPGLPGSVGDYLYPSLDGSGDLTTSADSRRPIYLKIADSIITSTTGTGIDPTGTDGDIVEINRIQITLASGNGTYTLDDAVALINNDSASHKVTAVKVGAATEVVGDIAGQGSAYGIVAGYAPFSASINGVTVNFTTTTSGSAAYGDPAVADANDMIADINAAGITDIVASLVNGSELKLRHNAGGAITIVNISADLNGNNFVGAYTANVNGPGRISTVSTGSGISQTLTTQIVANGLSGTNFLSTVQVGDVLLDAALDAEIGTVASIEDDAHLTLTSLPNFQFSAILWKIRGTSSTPSISSLPASTPANTTTFALRLTRADGGPLTIRDFAGVFLDTAGVLSGQNGRYALGLNIEQGIRTGGITVVADIIARDALNSLVGDQCHVINDGNNEWATFTYDGSQWIKTGGQRSVAVDARTLKGTVPLSDATTTIGTVSEDRRILNVSVAVLQDLIGAPDFAVEVGSTTVWQFSQHGSGKIGIYVVDTDLITTTREDVVVNIPSNSATGNIRVEVSYI
jgi:hypothetical protein